MNASDKYFFQLLIHGNKKQTISALKYINISQFKTLKKIASDILSGHIPLSLNQVKKLKRSASFIRNLGTKKSIHSNTLIKNYNIVKKLLKIKFDYVESCEKVSAYTIRRKGKNKRQKYERNETSSSEFTSSEESEHFSNESEDEKEGTSESEREREDISESESFSERDVKKFHSVEEK